MKKLISLGISIAFLITAFVLLPKQRHEDVIAGPDDGDNAKVETLAELTEVIKGAMGMSEDVTSGTISFEYNSNTTIGSADVSGGKSDIPETEEYDDDYYQAQSSYGEEDYESALGDYGYETDEYGDPIIPDSDEIKESVEESMEDEANDAIDDALSTLSVNLTTEQTTITLYFNENVSYMKISATFASRLGDDDDRRVLTYVYDVELYSEIDEDDPEDSLNLIRFNFFDGYSNNDDIVPVVTADKLGIWYEVDEDDADYLSFFTGNFASALTTINMTGLEKDQDRNYYHDSFSFGDMRQSISIDLENEEAPNIHQNVNYDDNDYLGGASKSFNENSDFTFTNINNTKVEFDLSEVKTVDSDDFEWDVIEDIMGFSTETDGGDE